MTHNRMAKRPGPTVFIIACFAVSMLFRIGGQGLAYAEVVDKPIELEQNVAKPSLGIAELLETLQERQRQLDVRETAIANRLQVLNSAEIRVEAQVVALRDAQEKLASTIAIADNASERDLARLTAVYEKMKPASAADIFQAMELSFAAGFLSRMKPDAAAGILSALPAEVAYSFSVVMAGRNANAPTE